jgi:nucleoside-diphosphate-sugar epimerase
MRIFVTGATGFIGSAVVAELLAAGHHVTGLARSDNAADMLAAAGAEAHRGALDDLDSLTRGAAASDGVVHLAFIHDFSRYAANGEVDLRAVEALGAALAGSGRPLVITSATTVVVPKQGPASEDDAGNPASTSMPRVGSEEAIIRLASKGVRASVVRLPPSVHGDGDRAFVPALIAIARAKGVSAYMGDGADRWPAVHLRDAARLFRLAVEKAPAGSRLHGVGEEGVPVRAIADVIGRRLNIPVVAKSPEDAAVHFGWLAGFLSTDCPASSAKTRQLLDWHPGEQGLVADLDHPRYFGV